MQKLENSTLQKFLDSFVAELKRENENRKYHDTRELDIPFIISTLYQSFNNNKDEYKELISDLEKWLDYSFVIENSTNDYDGIIDVEINLSKYGKESEEGYCEYSTPNYGYKLCFSYEERNWGYCECTPDLEDYREDKHCCGHGCDAAFCEFELFKVTKVIRDSWHGDKHDYWEFEDQFYTNDKELAEKREKECREREIMELKARIEADSKKLAELEAR